MDKKLLFILLSLPLASIAITWYIFNLSIEHQVAINIPGVNGSLRTADTFFNQVDIINYDVMGKPKSYMTGKNIAHYPGDNDSRINVPRITFFRDKGLPVYVSAAQGLVNKNGSRLILKTDTVIKREQSLENSFFQLETPELTVWPKKDFAATKKAVKIITGTTIVTGIGMNADLKKRTLSSIKKRYRAACTPKN